MASGPTFPEALILAALSRLIVGLLAILAPRGPLTLTRALWHFSHLVPEYPETLPTSRIRCSTATEYHSSWQSFCLKFLRIALLQISPHYAGKLDTVESTPEAICGI